MLVPLLLFVFVLTVYSFGVLPSVYGGDSGDVILTSWFGGVLHPPGYPLNAMLGWVFTHLPYSNTIAFKANYMAVFLMAASTAVTFSICQKLTKNTFVSLAASLVFAFNPLVWLYAHIIEVFQLNLLLVTISFWFLITWRETVVSKKTVSKYLNLATLFLGLAVFHHHTSVLLVSAYFYLIYKTNKETLKFKNLIKLALFFGLGFLPYLFVIYASFVKVPVNWENTTNLKSFIRLVVRADYGTFVAMGSLLGAELKVRLIPLFDFLLFLKSDFAVAALFIPLGAVYVFLKDRTMSIFIFICFFMIGPFFFFYSSFPLANDFFTGLWERFVLIPYFFLTIYLAYGLLFAYNFLLALIIKLHKSKNLETFYKVVTILLLLVLPLYMIRNNFYKVDLGTFKLGDYLGHDILRSAEPGSIIFLQGDTIGFNTEYIYFTNEEYKDLIVIRGGTLFKKSYRERVYKKYPQLSYPDNFLSEENDVSWFRRLVEKNIDKFPIYVADKVRGLENDYVLTNVGIINKILDKKEYETYREKEIVDKTRETLARLNYLGKDTSVLYTNFMVDHLNEIYLIAFLETARELEGAKHLEEATYFYSLVLAKTPDSSDAILGMSRIYSQQKDCQKSLDLANKVLSKEKESPNLLAHFATIYKNCFEDESKAIEFSNKAKDLRIKESDVPVEDL